jgi:DNA-binding NarL/FixJ family response regulator
LKKRQVKVLLADDFEGFRGLVSSLLRDKAELQIVAEVADGLAAVEKARQIQPDVILLDIGLPKLNGLDAARKIREVAPQSKIIFVTQEYSSDIVQEAIRLGASAYVAKTMAGSELVKAIDTVLQGRRFIGSSLAGSSYENTSE